jgi:tetratricopeptide (TPR) repeat protein/DNA-binding CsgD family transcriptional regulator
LWNLALLPLIVAAQPGGSPFERYAAAGQDTMRVRAAAELSYHYAYKLPDSSEYYAREALALSRRLGYASGESHALQLIGLVHRRRGDYPEALRLMTESLSMAERKGLAHREAAARTNIGLIYWNMQDYEQSLRYLRQALAYQRRVHNREAIANALNNLGMVSTSLGRHDSSLRYYEEAHRFFDTLQHRVGLPTTLHNLAIAWRELGDLGRSNAYLRQALAKYREQGNLIGESNALRNLGKNLFLQGLHGEALPYVEEALRIARQISARKEVMDAWLLRSDIEAGRGDYRRSRADLLAYAELRDSLLSEEQRRQIAEIQARYETEKKVAALVQAAERARLQRYALAGGLAALSALLAALAWAFRQRGQAHRAERERLRAEEEAQRLRAEKLQAELDFRNRELAAKAIHLVQKNDMLHEVSDRLRKVMEAARGLPEAASLRQTQLAIQSGFRADADWEDFKRHFEQVHNGFFDRLQRRFPSLTPHDLRFCAYLRMNLSTKEVASLLHLSPRGVETHRYRLRKKLGLKTHEDLAAWMMQA